jgi:hypothetical protein
MRWEGVLICMGEKRNAYKILVGKSEGGRKVEKSIEVDVKKL